MRFDFETVLDRTGKDSIAANPSEWYGINVETREGFPRIPMWVADMDFVCCPAVTNAVAERLRYPNFGYFEPSDAYYDAIISWQRNRHGIEVKREEIGYEGGVLGGLISALRVMCPDRGPVLLNSPTYIGFTNVLKTNEYQMILSPLKKDSQGIWRMDLEDMEKKIQQYGIRAAIVCNPYNPCGRVWTRQELKDMMDLFEKYGVQAVSDEIWSDLILKGHTHTPTHTVSEYARMHTVSEYALSKTFSLAGIVGSYHVIFNKELRDAVVKQSSYSHYNEMSVLWMHAVIGGLSSEGAAWTDEVCQVLTENISYAYDFITSHFPGVSVMKPEGTYMMFLDCTEYCDRTGTDMDTLLRKGVEYGVLWQDGRPFHGDHSIRMNLAVPFSLVKEAFDRLDRYVFEKEDR